MLISLAQYAQQHGKGCCKNLRRKCINGEFKTARKIGRNWVIDSKRNMLTEELPAASIKLEKKKKIKE